ncbi:MAG: hypothetical protein ABI240_04300 [Sphingomonas sp.]
MAGGSRLMVEHLPDLARRWARAIDRGRGIRIEAADLDLLTDIGVNDIIQVAAAEKLKERAKWRTERRNVGYANEASTGSIGTDGPMERCDPPTSRSSGTMASEDAHALLAHARQISRPQGGR